MSDKELDSITKTAEGTFYKHAGRFHRIDGPAIKAIDGTREWLQRGRYHRLDGPAIEWANGGKEWFQCGERHRVEGPAITWGNGRMNWWLNDRHMSKAEHASRVATHRAPTWD